MCLEQGLPLRRLADVALQRDEALRRIPGRGAAQACACLGSSGIAGKVDADAPTGLGQFKGDAAAQPARAAGDKGDGDHGCALAFGEAGAARLGRPSWTLGSVRMDDTNMEVPFSGQCTSAPGESRWWSTTLHASQRHRGRPSEASAVAWCRGTSRAWSVSSPGCWAWWAMDRGGRATPRRTVSGWPRAWVCSGQDPAGIGAAIGTAAR